MNAVRVMTLFFTMFCIVVMGAFPHPHVFIENSFTFVFGDGALEGISVIWVFDEMFSATLIMDFDRNRNRMFEANEVKALRTKAFANLASFNYFLSIDAGGGRVKIKSVKDFMAEILGKSVMYRFFVPLRVAAGASDKTIRAACFDDTYFCDIAFAKKNRVNLENDSLISCSWELADDKKSAYWGGLIVPKTVWLKFKIKDE